MKIVKFLLLMLFVTAACREDANKTPTPSMQWKKLGLDGKTINELHLHDGELFAATTTGLFRKPANGQGAFEPFGLDNLNIEAMVRLGDSWLVSVYDRSGAEPPVLYRSDDDGESWQEVNNDFGGPHPEPVFDLELHPNGTTLYGSGFGAIARSTDEGKTWSRLLGEWGSLATGISVVEVNPNNADELWAGGQGSIENGFLLRGEEEMHWDAWDDLVDNPTTVKEISFVNGNANLLLVGFEAALLKTTDGGEHWETLIDAHDDGRFFFGAATRAGDPDRLYAAGWLKTPDPQPLILFISDNGGNDFVAHRFSGEDYGGVLELLIHSGEDQDAIYLGLDKGGVYEVKVPVD